jgi:hypothetical protein
MKRRLMLACFALLMPGLAGPSTAQTLPKVTSVIPDNSVFILNWNGANEAGIFNQVLQVPAVRNAITVSQAADIVGGTPQQFDGFIKSELKRWPEVVKSVGIKPE